MRNSPRSQATEAVSPPQARILIVDNREQTRRDLRRELEGGGYSVSVAEGAGDVLHRDAIRLARKMRPHVVIVDLRLDDDRDTSDVSGLALLRQLRRQSTSVGLIVYSAYLNPNIDRAIKDCGAEWLDKDAAPEDFREMVERLAAQACAARRPLRVFWPRRWNKERAARRLFQKRPLASLLDDLIAQLFKPQHRVWVRPIEGVQTSSPAPVSRGRSLVIKVQIHQGWMQKVVKIALSRRIAREAQAYQRWVRNRLPGQFHTQLETTTLFWDAGASVYSFLGDGELNDLQTFRSFYATEQDVERLLLPIRFWRDLWMQAFPAKLSPVSRTIREQYDRLFHLSRKLNALRQHPTSFASNPELIHLLQRLDAKGDSPQGCGLQRVVHGDFHADNLFTDGQHLWLVDFERTGRGPVYADFCELEVDVLTRLLPPSVSQQDFQCLTQSLINFDATDEPSELDPEARKALRFVRALRNLAFESTGGQRYLLDYQWGLFYDALFVAGMRPDHSNLHEQMLQRTRACLYASMLYEHLEAP
ncbi:response regulator [Caldilinea sp.]|jgi:CheY-like chemotaxis protein|uniref:response regulator n=1 Tax=Caldilinea sp. TaxID=2293560 RepID=UPI001B1FF5B1|nr:response regulator [Caldilinea sp.]MBO9393779.1 response regulator [Caldilinea sp.]